MQPASPQTVHISTPVGAGLSGISVGPGTLLINEKALYSQFAPFGVSLSGFTRFRRALGVPCIYMPDNSRLVDLLAFQIALRAVFENGAPDFLMPPMHKGNGVLSRVKTPLRKSLVSKHTRENLKVYITELLYARRLNYDKNTKATADAVNRASDRLALSLARLIGEETTKEARRRLVRTTDSDSVVEPSILSPSSPQDELHT